MKFSNLCLNALDAAGQKKIVRSNYIKHSEISDDFLIFSTIEDVTNIKSLKFYDDNTHISPFSDVLSGHFMNLNTG